MHTISIESRIIRKVTPNEFSEKEDQLAIEEPLEIQISFLAEGKRILKNVSITMRTPGHDDELATGFLFTEGIIQNKGQVKAAKSSVPDENNIVVTLTDTETPVLKSLERNFYTTSSCGVCGKASIDAIKTISMYSEPGDEMTITKAVLFELPASLQKQQNIFKSTGGLHASALFDMKGNFIALREDVGRHNALDKVIGSAFYNDQLPLTSMILLLSGRASFELIQKANMAGIRIVAAIGAPSSLAAQLAEECNMTLIGFLGSEKFNIYSGWNRVKEL
ncbi:formate dehydrogenase accessory sulfurtransferase FdhD [Dyadobacter sp. NIV53]|uniref:formate dehydrogenase accessory sulfurtransferase FdhD n=1 Tax=Dyadobacter sp. NIV53 TaxID=2861765 RepID=UPI001C871EC7|nr:formate dehydrogenase accessory sulfurtransferase FdhD [Dyadobacter sp. NIV53]